MHKNLLITTQRPRSCRRRYLPMVKLLFWVYSVNKKRIKSSCGMDCHRGWLQCCVTLQRWLQGVTAMEEPQDNPSSCHSFGFTALRGGFCPLCCFPDLQPEFGVGNGKKDWVRRRGGGNWPELRGTGHYWNIDVKKDLWTCESSLLWTLAQCQYLLFSCSYCCSICGLICANCFQSKAAEPSLDPFPWLAFSCGKNFCARRIGSPLHADTDSVRGWKEFPPQELHSFKLCKHLLLPQHFAVTDKGEAEEQQSGVAPVLLIMALFWGKLKGFSLLPPP